MSRIWCIGPCTDVIGIEYYSKSSQMSMVSCIQFVGPELGQSPSATVVQQAWTNVCLLEPDCKGKIHFGGSPHAMQLSHRKLC